MKRTVSDWLLPLLADGLTLALLLAGSLVSVQAGYDLPIQPDLLAFTGLALALGTLLLFHLPRFQTLAVVLVLAAWGFWLWQGWEGLAQGGMALMEAILSQLTSGTGQEAAADAVPMVSALLLASIPWGMLAGWSLLRARSAGLTLLLVWLPQIPAFCANGGVCWPALLLLGAASLSCLLSARPVGEDTLARGARWRFLSLAASALLLLGLAWLSPAQKYAYPQWADSVRLWLEGYTEELPILTPGESGILQPKPSAGLSAEVDLTQARSPQYTGSPVLRVESSWTGSLYLRGYSLGRYTGNRWEPVQESAYGEKLPPAGDGYADSYRQLLEQWPVLCYPAGVQRNTVETVTVVDLGTPSDWVYAPYQINSLSGLAPVLDSSVSRSDGLWQHRFSFVPPDLEDLASLSGDWGAAETLYDQFVQENYLQLPDGMAEQLAPYVEQVLGGAVPGTAEAVETARQVAQLLDDLAEYDLSTPAPPAGEDFTLWFLEESHRGYCVHFATAGTLLLRAMGIPARYTAGYALPVTAGEAAEVPDAAAHAWVEIYLSGYGWYPVEMTPGGGNQLPGENLHQSQQQPETPDPSPEPSETPDQPEQPPVSPSVPEASTQPERGPEAEPEAPESGLFGAAISFLTVLLLTAACLTGLAFALWGGRTLWLHHWERKILQPDANRAVLEVYGRFQALCRWGGELPEEITALGKKAKFSQHRLTEPERRQAIALLTGELRKVGKSLSPWKRWLFWIVWDR